jgi:hypothetical protein
MSIETVTLPLSSEARRYRVAPMSYYADPAGKALREELEAASKCVSNLAREIASDLLFAGSQPSVRMAELYAAACQLEENITDKLDRLKDHHIAMDVDE